MTLDELPASEELRAAIERADEGYLLEWIRYQAETVEQVRAGYDLFFESL